MWILSFLPDSLLLYIVNTVLIVGAVSSFIAFFVINGLLRKFPTLAPYHLLLQIVSAILLVAGIYFKGGYSVEMEWRAKVAALQAKVALAEEKSKTVNAEIQTKIVTRTKVIHDTKIVTKEVLKEHTVMIDKECSVPDVITVLNKAATRPPLNLELPKEVVK